MHHFHNTCHSLQFQPSADGHQQEAITAGDMLKDMLHSSIPLQQPLYNTTGIFLFVLSLRHSTHPFIKRWPAFCHRDTVTETGSGKYFATTLLHF